jgi:hypothetical protein
MVRRKIEANQKLLQRARQLPASEPPAFAAQRPPQPIPSAAKVAQVFSTYDGLPIRARPFHMLSTFAPDSEAPSVWHFEVGCPAGYVMVARSVRIVSLPGVFPGNSSAVYNTYPPGALLFTPQVNGAALPFCDQVPWSMDEDFPLFIITPESSTAGLLVVSEVFPDETASLTALFSGEMLWNTGLPIDLQVGHEAAYVRDLPGVAYE